MAPAPSLCFALNRAIVRRIPSIEFVGLLALGQARNYAYAQKRVFRQEVKLRLGHILLHLESIGIRHLHDRLLHQQEDIAHDQDPPRHAIGVEEVKIVDLLTHTNKLDEFP